MSSALDSMRKDREKREEQLWEAREGERRYPQAREEAKALKQSQKQAQVEARRAEIQRRIHKIHTTVALVREA